MQTFNDHRYYPYHNHSEFISLNNDIALFNDKTVYLFETFTIHVIETKNVLISQRRPE